MEVVEEKEGTYTGMDWMEVRDGKINIQQDVRGWKITGKVIDRAGWQDE